ncbi:tyrosine--tRNA ligase [Sandaracinobacteroides saxicola]|uniref:Tyrosine--tRNA ligase n=1 Tax=Sandaracinobacteroides saxicola TaxID=2759707 RepID=A0A7G5IEA4_9SPHN|nr:tyrosine--tRNA ligase [Sandaracinobacteroides saxicola]QMW21696.1 tyrosine--tRNA ligase [Sandaracinobacteroides saxicola]
MSFKSPFLISMAERGYIHQITDAPGLDAAAPVTAYVGFDCTAPSLHIGNLVSIMMLRRLQAAGGKPIVLVGGGTTKVGDPSGKDEARALRTAQEIEANKAGIRRIFERFLTFGDGPTDALMLDNDAWLSGLNYIDFLRDYGRHFSVNRMLTMDSVRLRLDREQPLSFIEFNYMVLQAYDFLELHIRHGCRLQMGGSDQWGNIVNGIDLARRVIGAELFGLTTPLITTADGAKMGKTAQGALWLHEDQLPHWDYWQFWRNTDDRDVGRFLRLFTDLPMDEIARLEALQGAEINQAKVALANAATTLCRGAAAAQQAEATAAATFAGGAGDSLPRADIAAPTALADALVLTGLAASKAEARRKLAEGAVRVDGIPATDPTQLLSPGADPLKLSLGKKRHALLGAAA